MSKQIRHSEILRVIDEQDIATQAELVDALAEAGIQAAQATVSRDVAELGLVKVRGEGDHMVYAPAGTTDPDRVRALSRALRRWATTIKGSSNLVMISTPAGYADPLAQVIDEACHPDVLGTIAGANTVLVVADEGVTGAELADNFLVLTSGTDLQPTR